MVQYQYDLEIRVSQMNDSIIFDVRVESVERLTLFLLKKLPAICEAHFCLKPENSIIDSYFSAIMKNWRWNNAEDFNCRGRC